MTIAISHQPLELDLCDGPCRGAYGLFVHTRDGRQLCPPCWEGAGRPTPIPREGAR